MPGRIFCECVDREKDCLGFGNPGRDFVDFAYMSNDFNDFGEFGGFVLDFESIL